jgi:hypothetical protein
MLRNTAIRFSGFAVMAILFISVLSWKTERVEPFHSEEELEAYEDFLRSGSSTDLPFGGINLFRGSGTCVSCHGSDPLGLGNVDSEGNDINVVDDWRSTMMANSARDPFWKAKVSHEVHVNPALERDIEDFCTKCHAPAGHYGAKLEGAAHYSMADLADDEIGLDGVNCSACHQQRDESLGDLFSGDLLWDTSNQIFGPYDMPFSAIMISFVGLEPVQSDHINAAGLCAGCHTLITETVDLAGNLTGGTFVEQATYHEWENSRYEVEDVSCQECHIPRIDDPVSIANNYPFLPDRSPYGLHHLVGANTYMLELMKNNKDDLEIPATDAQFDSTIARTMRILQSSVKLDAGFDAFSMDTLQFEVNLENQAGHKFPSGYPARRAWIEVVLKNDAGSILWSSGTLDSTYELPAPVAEFEPHYDLINSESQTQIYEMVMGDVNGNFTTVLERGASHLKDNRLVPQGFTTSHPVYDTTLIAGAALTDPNFNFRSGVEGSGSDDVTYRIGVDGYRGAVSLEIRLWYQSLPPRWMEEMFAVSTPEIDSFKAQYFDLDPAPVLVADTTLAFTLSSTGQIEVTPELDVFPTASRDGWVNINSSSTISGIRVYDLAGRVYEYGAASGQLERVQLPEFPGVYLMEVVLQDGYREIFKLQRY